MLKKFLYALVWPAIMAGPARAADPGRLFHGHTRNIAPAPCMQGAEGRFPCRP
ncbi:MAG: hypothetical protein H0S80_04255 [Desulfovibrionaceae bacterium]|nr:hypothetical protein [Desulfovibrionaceae bacterium]